jgi:hypothetical protein
MLRGSDVPYAHTAREAAPIAWTPDTGSFVSATSVRCLLLPDHDCDAMLFDGAAIAAERRSPQAPALSQDGPALPVVDPYSGTFVTFPLR